MIEDKYHYRVFLNDGKGAAIVEALAQEHSWIDRSNGSQQSDFEGKLQITDCTRSIELDLSFHDIEGARGQLRKLDRLLDAIHGIRGAAVQVVKRNWPGRKL